MSALVVLQWLAMTYFVLANTFYGLLLVGATLELRRHRRETWGQNLRALGGSEVAPKLSVLAPAYNEAATVAQSVRALLTLAYPNLEVVLVNDGSSDATMDVLVREFELVEVHPLRRGLVAHAPVHAEYRSRVRPNLIVIDKANGGKADALNAALDAASGDLVCAIDADTLIESDALARMVRPFIERDDIVAAGGTIRVANGCQVRDGRVVEARTPRRLLAGVQAVEYTRAFLFGRLGWNRLGGNLIISGAFGLFHRASVIEAGGYLHATVGEDMELIARLRATAGERGTRGHVAFVADPVAWTEVPESLRVLARQRDRWHRGLADVLWRYRRLMGRPRHGSLGLLALPSFLFLELLAPLVEVLGLLGLAAGWATGTVDLSVAGLFFLAAYGYGLVLSVFALVLDELIFSRHARIADRLLLLVWAALENLGYRQATALWRLQGLLGFLRGRREWGVMTRRGFAATDEALSTPL